MYSRTNDLIVMGRAFAANANRLHSPVFRAVFIIVVGVIAEALPTHPYLRALFSVLRHKGVKVYAGPGRPSTHKQLRSVYIASEDMSDTTAWLSFSGQTETQASVVARLVIKAAENVGIKVVWSGSVLHKMLLVFDTPINQPISSKLADLD